MFSKLLELNKYLEVYKPEMKIKNIFEIIRYKTFVPIAKRKCQKMFHEYMESDITYDMINDFCDTVYTINDRINKSIPNFIIKVHRGVSKYRYILNISVVNEDAEITILLHRDNRKISIEYQTNRSRIVKDYEYRISGDSIKDIKIISRIKIAFSMTGDYLLHTDKKIEYDSEEDKNEFGNDTYSN